MPFDKSAKSRANLCSVWRVLRGPNNDWPLAVCDHRTIDHRHDVIANDVLHEDSVGENWLLHKSSRHSWYYLSDQRVEDLIVFRNTDSKELRPSEFVPAYMPQRWFDAGPRSISRSVRQRWCGDSATTEHRGSCSGIPLALLEEYPRSVSKRGFCQQLGRSRVECI